MLIGTAFGAILPGGPFTAYPVASALLTVGADFGATIAMVVSWTLIGYGRAVAWELPIMGTDFTLWRIVISLPLPVLAGALGRFVYVRIYPKPAARTTRIERRASDRHPVVGLGVRRRPDRLSRAAAPVFKASLREGSMDFINIVPRIALGVIGSGYIAAIIPQEVITGWLGPDSGWLGVADRRDRRRRDARRPGDRLFHRRGGAEVGGGAPQVIAYVVAWALFAFQRLILWEIPFMPARFVWFRCAVSLPFPFLAAAIAMAIGKP